MDGMYVSLRLPGACSVLILVSACFGDQSTRGNAALCCGGGWANIGERWGSFVGWEKLKGSCFVHTYKWWGELSGSF